jgi:hypothetical protein
VVDKVDRPKAPEPWTIKPTAESHERSQRERQEFAEDEFSSPGEEEEEWQRLQTTQTTPKVVRLNRSDIRHIWFRKGILQRGCATIECDIETANGTLLRAARFPLPRMDDYFQFKGYIVGQEVPVTVLFHDPVIEVSVPPPRRSRQAVTTPAAPTKAPVQTAAWWQLFHPTTGHLQTRTLLIYCVAIAAGIGVIIFLI